MRLHVCAVILTTLFVALVTTPSLSAAAAGSPVVPALRLASLPAAAEAQGVVEDDVAQLRGRLLVGQAAGATRIGVLFDLEPGWHVYWRNPGGTGIAPDLGLDVDGHRVGAIDWPVPQTFEEAEGLFTTWGYEGSVLLSAPIERIEGETPARVARADARVLVCRTQCVPAELSMRTPLEGALSAADQAMVDLLFQDALAQAPVSAVEAGLVAQARWRAESPATDEPGPLELTLSTCGASREDCPVLSQSPGAALFLPMEGDTFEYSPATIVADGDDAGRIVLGLEATRLEDGEDRLHGLVPIRDAGGKVHHVEIDVPIEGAATAAASTTGFSWLRWVQIFGLALLGGLILNGMPCVLPVLAIKVVAVADMAERDAHEVRMHGLAYTGGVLGSMGFLAVVVLMLRTAGHSVGWGFQFQEPLFVAGISALLVTFALNLFGAFEIELGQGRLATIGQGATGLRRSVFEGLLAVILATPCTAPFLGTAVGFAFASSGAGIVAIFLAIGLGLASPFLLVSFHPSFARFIPRSGPWMNTLRAGLGFSLLATVVWLLWVLGQSGGVDAIVSMTGMLLFLSFLLWGFGRMQPLRSVWLGRASAVAIAGVALTGFNLIELDPRGGVEDPERVAQEGDWAAWSEEAVTRVLAEGQPAFVVFTADWCITCKVNESTVLDREQVREAFAERGYALFKADWTRRDEVIRRKLAEYGRAGVPLYLVYDPTRPDAPRVLSELLSPSEVVTALVPAQADRQS